MVEEKYTQVQEQPAYRLAIPLFLLTSIPYFITLAYDYLMSSKPDNTFAWFGAFYLGLGSLYIFRKRISNRRTR